jgi:acetyl-CoA acyltransferase
VGRVTMESSKVGATRVERGCMPEAVIVDAVRTPLGKRNGGLASVHPTDLSAGVLNALVTRHGLDPGLVEDVQWGCVSQIGDQSSNVARYSVLAAGWPEHVPAVTINQACGSSQQALDHAAWAVMSGQLDLVVAGGVESVSRVPLGAARQVGEPYGPTPKRRYNVDDFDQLRGAELIAQRWSLDHTQLDEFSARSHERALAARRDGALADIVVGVETVEGLVAEDEGPRANFSTFEPASRPLGTEAGLLRLGNAAPFADAAAGILVTTPERARELGLAPIARYCAGAAVGADPVSGLTGLIPATAQVLKRSGLAIEDIGAFEVSEAFASIPLAWLADTGAEPEIVNVVGGFLALGHPFGASGAVLMSHLVATMRARGVRYGMQVMCEGGGQANVTVIELLA